MFNKVYGGFPWHADDSNYCVRFHREDLQAFKAPKSGTPFAEYWPGPKTIQWMLDALNEHERSNPMPHDVNQ
ncbi:MAG TPA: hypothetical protein V6C81_27545 [Planktothrix sp.]|jgi:hypothetical protein